MHAGTVIFRNCGHLYVDDCFFTQLLLFMQFLLFMLCVAVCASVNSVFFIDQFELMYDFLFYGSDASRVFAFYDAGQGFRQLQMFLFVELAVFYDVHSDVAVDVAQYIKVQFHQLIDFDDVFFAVFRAGCVLNDGNTVV